MSQSERTPADSARPRQGAQRSKEPHHLETPLNPYRVKIQHGAALIIMWLFCELIRPDLSCQSRGATAGRTGAAPASPSVFLGAGADICLPACSSGAHSVSVCTSARSDRSINEGQTQSAAGSQTRCAKTEREGGSSNSAPPTAVTGCFSFKTLNAELYRRFLFSLFAAEY